MYKKFWDNSAKEGGMSCINLKVLHFQKNNDILVCVLLDDIKCRHMGYTLNMGR